MCARFVPPFSRTCRASLGALPRAADDGTRGGRDSDDSFRDDFRGKAAGILAGDDPRATIGSPTQSQSDRCLVPLHLPRTTNEREPGAEEDPRRRTGYDLRRFAVLAFFALFALDFGADFLAADLFGAGADA
jgi:hypothetical protein